METTHLAALNGHSPPQSDVPVTLEIVIDPPVEWNQNTYDVMHLKEPTARQIAQAEQLLANGVNVHTLRLYQIALVSHGSGLNRAVVEQMRISQVIEAADFLARFTAGGPPTGESS